MTQRISDLIINIDNSEISNDCQFECGYNLWLHIRYSVYTALLKKMNPFPQPSVLKSTILPIHTYPLKNLISLFYSFYWHQTHSPFRIKKQIDYIAFNSYFAGEKSSEYKSKINNFFSDPPFNLIPLNIFSINNNKIIEKHINILSGELLMIQSINRCRYNNVNINNKNQIDRLIQYLKVYLIEFQIDESLEKLRNDLIKLEIIHLDYINRVKKFLNKYKPKFVVVEDGNYGGAQKGLFVFAANTFGVTTIEIQHGILDIAFQYGDKLLFTTQLKLHKTKYFLSFGKYWNNYVKSSCVCYDIGYPYLENKIKQLTEGYSNRQRKSIVFISQGIISTQLTKIAKALSVLLPENYIIEYRLHPSERSDIHLYQSLSTCLNIFVFANKDLYYQIQEAYCIVGSYSTVLLESLLFHKPVFVHDNLLSREFIPEDVGKKFQTEHELFHHIMNIGIAENNSNKISELYWTNNWKKSLSEFNRKENIW